MRFPRRARFASGQGRDRDTHRLKRRRVVTAGATTAAFGIFPLSVSTLALVASVTYVSRVPTLTVDLKQIVAIFILVFVFSAGLAILWRCFTTLFSLKERYLIMCVMGLSLASLDTPA